LSEQACHTYHSAPDLNDSNDAVIGVYHAGIPLSLNEQFAHENSASLFLPPYPKEVNQSKAEIERMVALTDPQATLSVAESGEITIQFSDGSTRMIDEGPCPEGGLYSQAPDPEGLYCLFYSNVR
jgi:hypothetical protein